MNRTYLKFVRLALFLSLGVFIFSGVLQAKPAVLALSWQTAFCETKPHKRECKNQRAGRYDITNFTLHGLWPGEKYCTRTPYRNLPEKLWKSLKVVMPGTASGLHRHEWEKHGTCYSKTPDLYYFDSIKLVLAFNKSPVRELFERKIGSYVSAAEIRRTFDESFGRGTGDRVLIHCVKDGNRRLIQELRIRLNGDMGSANLPVLLKQARPSNQGCRGGIIDAVGLQ